MNKYGAKKCEEDGYTFDSLVEREEYRRLKLRVLAGEVADIEVHPAFPLVVNGHKLGSYVGDFRYRDTATGATVVVDVKSQPTKTPLYRLKRKLMLALHGVDIVEVGA